MKKVIIILSLLISFIYAEKGRSVTVTEYDTDHGSGLSCLYLFTTRGIDKHGDGFIAIRSGPGSKYSIKNKFVKNGKQVVGCDSVGNWIGIIYADKDTWQGCGLDSDSSEKTHPYRGPCKTGWVYKKYLKDQLAG